MAQNRDSADTDGDRPERIWPFPHTKWSSMAFNPKLNTRRVWGQTWAQSCRLLLLLLHPCCSDQSRTEMNKRAISGQYVWANHQWPGLAGLSFKKNRQFSEQKSAPGLLWGGMYLEVLPIQVS